MADVEPLISLHAPSIAGLEEPSMRLEQWCWNKEMERPLVRINGSEKWIELEGDTTIEMKKSKE